MLNELVYDNVIGMTDKTKRIWDEDVKTFENQLEHLVHLLPEVLKITKAILE